MSRFHVISISSDQMIQLVGRNFVEQQTQTVFWGDEFLEKVYGTNNKLVFIRKKAKINLTFSDNESTSEELV